MGNKLSPITLTIEAICAIIIGSQRKTLEFLVREVDCEASWNIGGLASRLFMPHLEWGERNSGSTRQIAKTVSLRMERPVR